jgi:hypothetical protein
VTKALELKIFPEVVGSRLTRDKESVFFFVAVVDAEIF